MNRRVLVLDCDGVIFDVVKLMKEIISQINWCCSDEFKTKVIDRAFEQNETELYNKYNAIHKITKDEVLEETSDLYENKIPYDEIYTIKNTFHNVIEAIKDIWESRLFDKIYVASHVNSVREIEAKKRFFAEYLPFVEVKCFYFNDQPYIHDKERYYENAFRKRSNKPRYFFKETEERPENCYFIDDSNTICGEARVDGAHATWRDPEEEDPLAVFQEMLDNMFNIDDEKVKSLKHYW